MRVYLRDVSLASVIESFAVSRRCVLRPLVNRSIGESDSQGEDVVRRPTPATARLMLLRRGPGRFAAGRCYRPR